MYIPVISSLEHSRRIGRVYRSLPDPRGTWCASVGTYKKVMYMYMYEEAQ